MSQAEATASRSWLQTRVLDGVDGADIGLLLLRLALGIVFLGHGLQKLGWFEGGGYPSSISEQEDFLAFFGYSSTEFLAWVVTLSEVVAGISLLLGLITPLGAAAAMGIMFQFIAGPQWDGGLFGDQTTGGFEFTLMPMAAAAALAFVGPGRLSVDHALKWRFDGLIWGAAAVVLAVVVGAIVLEAWGVGLGGSPPPLPPVG